MRMFQSALSLTRICTKERVPALQARNPCCRAPGRLSPSHSPGEGPWGPGGAGASSSPCEKGKRHRLRRGSVGDGSWGPWQALIPHMFVSVLHPFPEASLG